MKIFEITGQYKEKGKTIKFTIKVKAESSNYAAEKVLCQIGSNHKIKRRQITINETKEIGEANGGEKAS
jgi:ribosomal protein L20A (L18A)|tara:strand:- start:329 stop:535 length:207 start_codon:yes stop_codon:yes gene_type:complete